MGTITFPSDGSDYSIDLNCYFKIEVSNGKKVKITFKMFNIGEGVDYGITALYPAYELDKETGEFYVFRRKSIHLNSSYLSLVFI